MGKWEILSGRWGFVLVLLIYFTKFLTVSTHYFYYQNQENNHVKYTMQCLKNILQVAVPWEQMKGSISTADKSQGRL